MIAAIGKNRELGIDNKLLWHIPADMKNFVKLTKGKPIIVGRKTFESFKGPLPKRLNVIITTNKEYKYEHENVVIFHDPIKAVKFLESENYEEAVVCGGAIIYEYFLPLVERFYLSKVDWEGEADTFFPKFNEEDFSVKESQFYEKIEDTPAWEFLFLEKKI